MSRLASLVVIGQRHVVVVGRLVARVKQASADGGIVEEGVFDEVAESAALHHILVAEERGVVAGHPEQQREGRG